MKVNDNTWFVAGDDPNILYTSREAAQRDIARGFGINTAGLSPNTEVVERRAAVTGDPGACLKLLKSMSPRGLSKGDAVIEQKPLAAKVAETVKASVHDLIKAAQGSPLHVEDLERGYGGREQASLAKAAAAEAEKIGADDLDRVSPTLRKVLGDFDAIVRRAVKRAIAV
jgi:hypothetical protein